MSSSISDFWGHFFSGRNILQWCDIKDGSAPDDWSEDIIPWLHIAERNNPDLPLILPCLDADGGVTWYAGANSNQSAQRLSEELQAFIGPSYSDYNKRPYIVDSSDEVGSAFAEICSAQVFRFSPSNANQISKIRRSIKLYRGLVNRYKAPDSVSAQSFGVIRGEFDRALLAGDEDEARRKYDQLVRSGRLSADNRLYLEVRLLAGLGRWPQIAGDSRLLRALSDLVLPPRVLADVIEALYRVYIESVEIIADAPAALKNFRDAGIDRYRRLFSTRRELTLPRVLKAFFLYELCRKKPDIKRLESILDLLIGEDDSVFIAGLRDLIPKQVILETSQTDQTREADIAFEDDDFEYALDLYMELPPSKKRLRRMLSCARVIGACNTAQKVLSVIDLQHKSDIDTLSQSANETLEYLRHLVEIPELKTKSKEDRWAGEDPRKGWLQWAHFVTAGLESKDSKTILQENAVNWDTRIFATDAPLVEELAAVMGNADDSAAKVFRDAYPHLFEAFVLEVEKPVRVFKPLLNVLLTNTVLLEGPSQDELELVRQLTTSLITIGLSEKEYDELITDLEELLNYQSSLLTMSWALDVSEILAIHSCPNPESRLRFFIMVLGLARRVSHRLSSFHYASLELLCRDMDLEFPVELAKAVQDRQEKETDTARQCLANKKIAIYTLTEQAGKRAAIILKQQCPEVTVVLNNDKVCTDKLIALARNADIFVFAWLSSKHQPFYCVKKYRPDGWPILMPLGKGFSSIVQIVETTIL